MTKLHYLDPNSNGFPVTLLLHGLGANASSWILQIPALIEAGYRPLAVDIPGFGKSPYDGRSWNIRGVANQLEILLGELITEPVHVVGLSMGGTIAQQLAFDAPHMIRSLVLVSTFAKLRPETLRGWLYFLRRFFLVNFVGLQAQARAVARQIFPDPNQEQLREILLESISQADPRAYRRAMASLGLFNSTRRLLEINAPTLIITGENDTTVTPARQRLLVAGIPTARQVIIPRAGHAVPVEQADAFNIELLNFLKQY
jgi:3-oxoadipate enol-lactonase